MGSNSDALSLIPTNSLLINSFYRDIGNLCQLRMNYFKKYVFISPLNTVIFMNSEKKYYLTVIGSPCLNCVLGGWLGGKQNCLIP